MNTQDKAHAAIQEICRAALAAPKHIFFGSHLLEKKLPELLRPLRGGRALLVTGRRSVRSSGLMDSLENIFRQSRIQMIPFSGIYREPTTELIDEAVAFAREQHPELVVAAGGGSVMDSAKAIAALLANEGCVSDYLEGSPSVRRLEHPPLPLYAVPTTAGTGAEMTRNAVICVPEQQTKRSMRDTRMIPLAALIDPALTRSVPPATTAAGGLDAITQLIEVCISNKRTMETTALALQALPKTAPALMQAFENGSNRPAREQLSYASFVSGVCLANSGLAMAHGIAAGLGALLDMPHGLACGILLPHTLEFNQEACPKELMAAMTALLDRKTPDRDTIHQGIALLHQMNRQLGIPPSLKHLYLKDEDVHRLAHASLGSSMSGNPVEMNEETIRDFLRKIT